MSWFLSVLEERNYRTYQERTSFFNLGKWESFSKSFLLEILLSANLPFDKKGRIKARALAKRELRKLRKKEFEGRNSLKFINPRLKFVEEEPLEIVQKEV